MSQSGDVRVALVNDKKVDICLDGRTVHTGSPETAGEGHEPTPLELFEAALGASAGSAVLEFCRQRGVSTEGVELSVSAGIGMAGRRAGGVDIEVTVPAGFPLPFKEDLVHAAESCEVGRLVTHPPVFSVRTRTEAARRMEETPEA